MSDEWGLAVDLLRTTSRLLDGISSRIAAQGFDDVRPVHGFAFTRISAGPVTTAGLGDYLGMTKQAAAQLVEQLVSAGYLIKAADPNDGRARLLILTERGWACTRAAEAAATQTVLEWQGELSTTSYAALRAGLATIAPAGRLRPTW